MNLYKTSFFSAIATTTKIVVAFVINKVIALYIGPAGLAIVGQLQNFIMITMTCANGAINQGVVKYTSEYRESDAEKKNCLAPQY